ncbi:Uncharacterised protein [Mycobacteroides abscessus subsp. massiliense]|uniref:hypothetical protein n=1 Tax=Mycobacteroides abscessus TaxID=36809 RepID=UPI0009A56A9B|nr:hypothetical protein [Mycobacteroides abscessus]SKH54358.1 Uncharacterised protein [Mycobacteroides abscessus subsp. massiliense]SKH84922.1 Uncharacterised protein [Mycobacteroides abscessus subsp. massiliense]SKK33128.1 Uncharacterised protein [Mycobacteroides abscessus subsp. massiliense]SKK46436.1 Uncharacterised protein [Mycobacteroides abscessus subsp. massiliense]SKL87899.1 Uncharacterised protein [Mycobacteroides abscessus subsp. massiliense]
MSTPAPPSTYATAAELATYMQTTFDAGQQATADQLLGFAALLIRNEYKDIDSRTPPIDPGLPQLVSLELVSRKMIEISTRGAKSITEAMDDITYTEVHDVRFGGLALDAWALQLLSPTDSSSGQRAFGVRTIGPTAQVPNNPWDQQSCAGFAYEVYPFPY